MPQQTINIGSAPDDGTGDTLRVGGDKINDNFTELYTDKADKAGGTFTGDISVPDEAYDATAWNGSTEVPTKNAIRDKIESLGSGITELDDIPDVNAPTPSNGDVLTWDSTPGEWVAAAPTGGGASTTQDDEMIAGFIASPSDKSYTIALKMAHGGTITETTTKSASGTCTATFKVNSTALGGTANSVSSAEQSQAHASTNTFVAGDDIVLTVSSNSSCADMSFSIKYTRTLD